MIKIMQTQRYHLRIPPNPLFHHLQTSDKQIQPQQYRYRSLGQQNNYNHDHSLRNKKSDKQQMHQLKLPHYYRSQGNMHNVDISQHQNINDLKNYLHQAYNSPIIPKTDGQKSEQKIKIIQKKYSLSNLHSHQVFEKKLRDRIQEDYKKSLQKVIKQKQILLQTLKAQKQRYRNKATNQVNLNHKIQSYNQFFCSAIAQKQKIYSEYSKYMEKEEMYQKKINKSKLLNLQKDFSSYRIHAQSSLNLDELKKKHYRQSLQRQTLQKLKQGNINRQQIKTEPTNSIYGYQNLQFHMRNRQGNLKYNILNKNLKNDRQ